LGRAIQIGQCNNALIFPGLGLGVIAGKTSRITDSMFAAAANALAETSPALLDRNQPLYPGLKDARRLSQRVALAVALQAEADGVAQASKPGDLPDRIARAMWTPHYSRYTRVPIRPPQAAGKENL